MSKLFNLKEWLTLDEAAQHLSDVLGELVEVKDIYRLTLDGHLVLSVNFVNQAHAKLGKIVAPDEINWDGLVTTINGVWDLMMVGSETLDIEHFYQQLTGGPSVTLASIEAPYVRSNERVAQIQKSFEHNDRQSGSKAQKSEIPVQWAPEIRSKFQQGRKKYINVISPRSAGGLPADSVFVVRKEAIIDFLQLQDTRTAREEKPLSTKERQSLLVIIAALCKDADIDYTKRGMANSFVKMTEELGAPVSEDTIRKVLKQLEEAVSARSK